MVKFTTVNYVWQALQLLIVRLSISSEKLTQKLTAAVTEKKTNSNFFLQGQGVQFLFFPVFWAYSYFLLFLNKTSYFILFFS